MMVQSTDREARGYHRGADTTQRNGFRGHKNGEVMSDLKSACDAQRDWWDGVSVTLWPDTCTVTRMLWLAYRIFG